MKNTWIIVAVVVIVVIIGGLAYYTTMQSANAVSYKVGTIVLNNDDYFAELYLGGNQVKWPAGATVTPFTGNTGAVQNALAAGSIDMGIAGQTMIQALCGSNPASLKIVADQVDPNHQWALFVKNDTANLNLNSMSQLQGKNFGVSRVGSEGYSMTVYFASTLGWTSSQYKYTAVGGLTALVSAVDSGSIDAFFWDTSTTGPLVQQGLIREVFTTPYPGAFSVVMATNSFISSHPTQIKDFLNTLYKIGQTWNSNQTLGVQTLMTNYNMSQSAATQAYSEFTVSTNGYINTTLLSQTLHFLQSSGNCPANFNMASTYTTQFAKAGP